MDKHIVLTNGRSGSNYITNCINSHPRALNYGEVLGDWTLVQRLRKKIPFILPASDTNMVNALLEQRKWITLGQLYSVASRVKRGEKTNWKDINKLEQIGIKDFFTNISGREFETYLCGATDIKVIYLYRSNVFNRFVSYKMLETTQRAVARNDGEENKVSITLELDDLISNLAAIEVENVQLATFVQSIEPDRRFDICYEKFFSCAEKTEGTVKKMYEFLGLQGSAPLSNHVRINPRWQDVVANHREVLETLRGTKYDLTEG